MFAVTNIDDMVLLAVFFGRAAGRRDVVRVVTGQYLGFVAILALSVCGAVGAGLLPDSAIPYLGLLPLLVGLRLAWRVWRSRRDGDDVREGGGVGVLDVASVTLANGGDNIAVYVPVFAVVGTTKMVGFVGLFLVGVAIWCAAGWFVASRPPVARMLSRWGHVMVPAVLIGIGLAILVEGGAFGL
ncbi:MAG: cadmium resistance transporter [Mycobacteriaceae bacterium]|nr:cadmium resistance transporter [Mycobacteriaceae bacterium]